LEPLEGGDGVLLWLVELDLSCELGLMLLFTVFESVLLLEELSRLPPGVFMALPELLSVRPMLFLAMVVDEPAVSEAELVVGEPGLSLRLQPYNPVAASASAAVVTTR
jgi:hypothetical protein